VCDDLDDTLQAKTALKDNVQVKELRDEWEEIKVTCTNTTKESVLDFFYISVPVGSTIAALRAEAGDILKPGVEIFVFTGMSMQKLGDDALVPYEVMVKELTRPISGDMILTKRQCQQAQAALEVSLAKAEIQRRLDELENTAKGNDNKYRILLTKMLAEEVYPDIFSCFDLPATPRGIMIFSTCVGSRADLPMTETWLRLETLMRNKAAMARAYGAIEMAKMNKAMGA